MFPENWTDIRSEVQVGQWVMDVCPQLLLYCTLNVKPGERTNAGDPKDVRKPGVREVHMPKHIPCTVKTNF